MAENESLEPGKAPRWQRVGRAICGGEATEEVANKAHMSLYRTLRAVKKLIPFKQLGEQE